MAESGGGKEIAPPSTGIRNITGERSSLIPEIFAERVSAARAKKEETNRVLGNGLLKVS